MKEIFLLRFCCELSLFLKQFLTKSDLENKQKIKMIKNYIYNDAVKVLGPCLYIKYLLSFPRKHQVESRRTEQITLKLLLLHKIPYYKFSISYCLFRSFHSLLSIRQYVKNIQTALFLSYFILQKMQKYSPYKKFSFALLAHLPIFSSLCSLPPVHISPLFLFHFRCANSHSPVHNN